MENHSYAIQYFQIKEKALIQRHHIDHEMAVHLNKLKEDRSVSGKAALEAYQQEIKVMEETFNNTVSSLQPKFENLFTQLKNLGATKDKPYNAELNNHLIHFYIDDNNNIHYRKTE